MKQSLIYYFLIALALFAPSAAYAVPAFPTAEGFGAQSLGGRGGKVIQITNLNGSGAGSFRECANASGARTCVFRVNGTINLGGELIISQPYLTVAGQTAPGDGVTFTGGTISIQTHNVVMRYIRTRGSIDGINMLTPNAHDIVLDHVTSTWGADENMSTYTGDSTRVRNVSIQWSILAEGLTPHSKGLLLGYATDISVHHNLFAHNDERSPRCQVGNIDIVNNVIYNYGASNGWCDTKHGAVQVNYIGNYTKKGPNSVDKKEMQADSTGYSISVYAKGNIGPNRTTDSGDEWTVVGGSGYTKAAARFPYAAVTTTSAAQAYTDVLAKAGASGRIDATGTFVFNRDGNTTPAKGDTRLINDVRNGTGSLVSSMAEAGGLPILSTGTPYPDTDNDGMSDTWETTNFGNLSKGSATASSGDTDGDGYTDLEEFLNGTAPTNTVSVTPSITTSPTVTPSVITPTIPVTTTVSPTVTGTPPCAKKAQGDANCDGVVNLPDYEIWRKEFTGSLSTKTADFNGSGEVNITDFESWRRTFLA